MPEKIRATVPKLPKGMGQKRGCVLCGTEGELTCVPAVEGFTLGGKPMRFIWKCKGGCRDGR